MEPNSLLAEARVASGLSQAALAGIAGTSRTTISAYENGHKSPTLETAARIVGAAGFDLAITPTIEFHEVGLYRGRPIVVPTTLPRLPLRQAFAVVELPLRLNWSDIGRRYDLRDRQQRASVYEVLLEEGLPDDVLAYLDGALFVDIWDDLVVPRPIRNAWEHLVSAFDLEAVA